MSAVRNLEKSFLTADTLYPRMMRALWRAEVLCQVIGITAVVVRHGLTHLTNRLHWELGFLIIAMMLVITVSLAFRIRWSLARTTFLQNNRGALLLSGLWIAGLFAVLIFIPLFPEWNGRPSTRAAAFLVWSELLIIVRGLFGLISVTRRAEAQGTNPALILVLSFVVLITIGTTLLMFPKARVDVADSGMEFLDQLRIALFTATSASCVTGLTVVDTGGETPYWSGFGQVVILCLFQIGGLGIMTCGAFFALASGRHVPIRESATLRDMLESDRLGDVRRLVFTILAFTLLSELAGAILISGLWEDRPVSERIFYSAFHSVSAFCNAGFALTDKSFVDDANRWQVWGVVTGLIILGGLGFSVLYNVVLVMKSRFTTIRFQPLFNLPRERVRLSLTSKLVIGTTVGLLLAGAIGYYVLESLETPREVSEPTRLSNAWFQSVTFRTAGFNTVDHSQLQPATKLMAIGLMFVGASPGSTGGGVRTTCFALAVLAVLSILRGRQRVEFMGRTIPDVLINRALTIISLGMVAVMTVTLLLVLFERKPELFLDHLFEATSAFATVGVSSVKTNTLTAPSQLVIVVTMFLGRVGPLTLLMALAGQMKDARYDYPIERVTLG